MTAIPVICDRCRAEGHAGEDPFAAIADLLEFEPVKRRAHVNNWTAEHQRALIAALATTGSPRQASAVLPYLGMALLYKRANPLWQWLIRHRLTHALWSPLVRLTRARHRHFRARLAASPSASVPGPLRLPVRPSV